MSKIYQFQLLCFLSIIFLANPAFSDVVINEIHYNTDVKTELVEFIELYNSGSGYINLDGWFFSGGISYQFGAGAVLPARSYIIVTQNPAHIQAKWSHVPSSLVYGPFEGKLENDGEKIELYNSSGEEVDQVDYRLGFPWPTVGDPVPENQPGTGPSIQLVQPSLDNDLAGSWRSAYPTPAARNISVYLENTPPHIRQVKHSPKEPVSGEAVTITAKVTDSDGVAAVVLNYQIVEPGNYIGITNPAYQTNWNYIDMHDDGLNGDEQADDDIYTVELTGTFQRHRRLIRYRIEVVDSVGNDLLVPYSDDPQPNFAYFVYDGVPPWRGAIRPGYSGTMGQVVEYGEDVMNSLPVYHLISKNSDIETCTFRSGYMGSEYRWHGTLVYDGEVYDHIRYRARGGVWRYAMGKNMWKFDFNRGHYFQARDDYGKKYKTTWDKLNFSACIQQGNYLHRGEQGMFEAAGFKMFNLLGVEAPKSNWLQFRIIDDSSEYGPTQYEGDFWGLYMTLEQMDGRFLDEHDLPDGNLYKIEGFNGELNNQGPTAVTNKSDLTALISRISRPAEQWWRDNIDLERYYSYRCVVEGIHHGDIGYGKNYFFYLNPENNIWSMLPWDIDLTWAENMYGNGEDPFKNQGAIFSNPALEIEYQNRLREFQDLLYNPDQMNQLLDELADFIDPDDGPTIVDADRAMWDYNPIMSSNYVNSSKAGQGRFYQQANTQDFRGMVKLMKDYVVFVTNNTRNWYGQSGPSMNSLAFDSQMPYTPETSYTGTEGYPIDDLTFQTNSFSDPQGNGTFGAMKWRIAEVAPHSQYAPPPQNEQNILIEEHSQWKYFKGTEEPSNVQGQWRQLNFNDSTWLRGVTPIGYGESFIVTELADMRGGYSTLYLRKIFNVPDLEEIDTLSLEAMFDDGINIWINGTHVLAQNVSSTEMPYDSAVPNRTENHTFTSYILSNPRSILQQGSNIIAVQIINQSLGNSSDCFVDIRLISESSDSDDNGNDNEPEIPDENPTGPVKFEIETVWESDEITAFNNSIQIPGHVVNIGNTYRVRCRMMDNTGRWSHWSAPVQFETSDPVFGGVLTDLRITEIMYHPADSGNTNDEDTEFIELKNIGSQTLNLDGVCFTNGIDFTFPNMDLDAGRHVLVVCDIDAFTQKYDTDLYIAGEYSGQLNNGGERIELEDAYGRTILDFSYQDDWYEVTDGNGYSLTVVDPGRTDAAQWGEKDTWRASANIDGSPGRDD